MEGERVVGLNPRRTRRTSNEEQSLEAGGSWGEDLKVLGGNAQTLGWNLPILR